MIIRNKRCWEPTQAQKDEYIERTTSKLAALRTHADISREDLANIIDISRHSYCAVECRKRMVSWNTYLSLIFFGAVSETLQMSRERGAYPAQPIEQFNNAATL